MKKLILSILIWVGSSGQLPCQATTMETDLLTTSRFPHVSLQTDDTPPLPTEATTKAFSLIHQLAATIQDCYVKMDAQRLQQTYQEFNQLTLEDTLWEAYATKTNIFVWPQQNTWKEITGAHLFFPPKALDWFDCRDHVHLLRRFDMIWGFTISAKFNHSLGKYLLVDTLFRVNGYDHASELSPFFQNYLTSTLSELESLQPHTDADYLLGRSQSGIFPRLVSSNKLSLTAHGFFSRSNQASLRNQYHALGEMKTLPLITDYRDLADQQYFQAYIAAATLLKDDQEKEDLLKEAADKGYGPAFLELGYLYEEQEKFQEAAHYYQQAALSGLTKGSVASGILKVGDPRIQMKHLKKDLTTFSEETIEEAATFFSQAGNTGDPEGWECLIALRKELLEGAKKLKHIYKKEAYEINLIHAIQAGMKIGVPYAYRQAQVYFKEEAFLACVRKYGAPLRTDIRMNWGQPKCPIMLDSVSDDLENFLTGS